MKPMLVLLVALAAWSAGAGQPDDSLVVSLDPGKLYRKVNGDDIFGRDVLDLLLEQDWERNLKIFINYKILSAEASSLGIAVSDAELNSELEAMYQHEARRKGKTPDAIKREALASGIDMETLRVELNVLRLLQREGKIAPEKHTWEPGLKQAVAERLEKLIAQKGVERDPKNLGTGEAVRIGGRGYAVAEVREFLLPHIRGLSRAEMKKNIEFLTLDKMVQRALKEKSLELTKDDAEFHFSYLCREREATTGSPGRQVLMHEIQQAGLTPREFVQTRPFRCDAGLTLLAKQPVQEHYQSARARKIPGTLLEDEFKAHPERYQRKEKLISHLLVRVLDPDGRPYGRNWMTAGHGAINAYVNKMREDQFAAAKPKIEGLVALAKENFEHAAKKYSEDRETAVNDGKIGRIGKDTILVGSFDEAVRDAAMKLKPGEISEPVRSAFGWHLIKCLDNQDVTFDESAERVYLNVIKENRAKLHDMLTKTAKIEDMN